MKSTAFSGAQVKLKIASVDDTTLEVYAQYNPKELQITQPIGWTEHEALDVPTAAGRVLEFGGMKSASMQVELLFDDVETYGTQYAKPVMAAINKLKRLASVQDPHSIEDNLRRPHYCTVIWGFTGMRPFRCVIESLVIKYLVFAPNGDILRASATVSLKEADRVFLSINEETRLDKGRGFRGHQERETRDYVVKPLSPRASRRSAR